MVLTEDALTDADAAHVAGLYEEVGASYRVLVPADTEQNMLVALLDHLSLGELRAALDAVLHRDSADDAVRDAHEDLAASLAAFGRAGVPAEGEVVDDDPLPALRAAVSGGQVREIVVVTRPHAVEDTFRTDWASRAREVLDVPVLHIYSGTNLLG